MPDEHTPGRSGGDERGSRGPRLDTETAESALRLRALRDLLGLSQRDIAEVLETSSRTVGYIEEARRPLRANEEKRLGERYPEFKTLTVRIGDNALDAPRLYPKDEYFPAQQDYVLGKQMPRRARYDFWILNPGALPMLRAADVRRNWTENLVAGASYNVVWFLNAARASRFRNFIRAMNVVREDAAVMRGAREEELGDDGLGRIGLWACDWKQGPDLTGEYDKVKDLYESTRRLSQTDDGVVPLNIGEPMILKPDEAAQVWELLFGFCFFDVATVGIVPKREHINLSPRVVLEAEQVVDFEGLDPRPAHIIQGHDVGEMFVRLIGELERLLPVRK